MHPDETDGSPERSYLGVHEPGVQVAGPQTPGQVRFKGEVVFTTTSGRELVAFVSGFLCAWQSERAL